MAIERWVYIVDDDEAVRDSIALSVELAGFRSISFISAIDFLARAPSLPPGCLLTDVRMPDMDGLELQEELHSRKLHFPMIVMTGHGDIPMAVRAIKAGATDFLEKPFNQEIFLDCIQDAFKSSAVATHHRPEINLVSLELESPIDAEAAALLATLSAREGDVLAGLLRGHANKIIAYELGLSPRTVEVYRARLMDKMMVRSLAELVTAALAGGFVARSRGTET